MSRENYDKFKMRLDVCPKCGWNTLGYCDYNKETDTWGGRQCYCGYKISLDNRTFAELCCPNPECSYYGASNIDPHPTISPTEEEQFILTNKIEQLLKNDQKTWVYVLSALYDRYRDKFNSSIEDFKLEFNEENYT